VPTPARSSGRIDSRPAPTSTENRHRNIRHPLVFVAAADRQARRSARTRLPMPITINGASTAVPADPRVSLLDLLREHLHLSGAKKGCNQGACGACTVLVDGDERILACMALAVQYEGRAITSIEGLATDGVLHPLQQKFIDHDGFQCGYCTPGQICSAIGMAAELKRGVPSNATDDFAGDAIEPTVDELRERMSGNVCRCGAYNGIVAAIAEEYAGGVPAPVAILPAEVTR
jgi:xanthine dehydrogenase YagT iron-sulfur-binding subunit